MGDQNYYRVTWSAYAVIEGDRLEIAGFEITYQLDEIPIANFWPVVGRDAQTGQEANALNALLDAVPFSEVKIYVRGETEEDSPQAEAGVPGFPYNQDVMIFDGYYQGVSYRSGNSPSGGSTTVAGRASGWMLGLMGTSGQVTTNTVKGPAGFAEVANIGIGAAQNPTALFNISSVFVGGAETAVADLWKQFIKPLFLALTKDTEVWGSSSNESAEDTLNRMDGSVGDLDGDLTLSFQPLAGDVPQKIMGNWLGINVAHRMYNRWRNGSLWSALKQLAVDFTFRIVPLIDTAVCAPVIGSLGGAAYVFIAPDEYHDVNMHFQTPELITKLVVVSQSRALVSAWSEDGVTGAIVGQHSAEEAWSGPLGVIRGLTVKIDAPYWLSTTPSIGEVTRLSVGKDQVAIPDAVNPTAFEQSPSDEEDYQKIYNNYITSDAGDRYAKTKLLDIMLASRGGSLNGRFRLDVAPGSTVGVEVIGGGKFSGAGGEPKRLFGLVEAVTLVMDAGTYGGTGRAATSFKFSHVRTAEEQNNYGGFLTEAEHPIFETFFRGAQLWSG